MQDQKTVLHFPFSYLSVSKNSLPGFSVRGWRIAAFRRGLRRFRSRLRCWRFRGRRCWRLSRFRRRGGSRRCRRRGSGRRRRRHIMLPAAYGRHLGGFKVFPGAGTARTCQQTTFRADRYFRDRRGCLEIHIRESFMYPVHDVSPELVM